MTDHGSVLPSRQPVNPMPALGLAGLMRSWGPPVSPLGRGILGVSLFPSFQGRLLLLTRSFPVRGYVPADAPAQAQETIGKHKGNSSTNNSASSANGVVNSGASPALPAALMTIDARISEAPPTLPRPASTRGNVPAFPVSLPAGIDAGCEDPPAILPGICTIDPAVKGPTFKGNAVAALLSNILDELRQLRRLGMDLFEFLRLRKQEEEKTYVSVGEAARICGKSPDTIRRWIRQGRLKARKSSPGVDQGQHMIRRRDLGEL